MIPPTSSLALKGSSGFGKSPAISRKSPYYNQMTCSKIQVPGLSQAGDAQMGSRILARVAEGVEKPVGFLQVKG